MKFLLIVFLIFSSDCFAQTKWVNIDHNFPDLPDSFHVYVSRDSIGGKPNIMYYAICPIDNSHFSFATDTSYKRRLTPLQYFEKNNHPLLIVNGGFFSFATNGNLNAVVRNGKLVGLNSQSLKASGKDSLKYYHPFYGTFGILANGKPDVAWTYSDSSEATLYATQKPVPFLVTPTSTLDKRQVLKIKKAHFAKWNVMTAIGGGPVLVQNGKVHVTNNEERKFYGKAVYDRHPRTAIGYTFDNRLIVFVCDGRSDSAAGLTLPQMAEILKNAGCKEALNLDGGGSTCLLIRGREVNTPSSKGIQRPVPSVFVIEEK